MSERGNLATAQLQARKDRLHTTMLIELLALLVFMAMAFAFVQKEQDLRANPLSALVERLKQEVRQIEAEVRRWRLEASSLRSENEMLREANNRLFAQLKGTEPANASQVVLTKSELDRLNADLARSREQAAALKAANDRLGGKGVGYPNCLVGGGYYFRVLLSANAFHVEVVAPAGGNPAPSQVQGLADLVGKDLNERDFEHRAAAVRQWGLSQATPCMFSAKVKETHSNLSLYKRQTATVSHAFYWGQG